MCYVVPFLPSKIRMDLLRRRRLSVAIVRPLEIPRTAPAESSPTLYILLMVTVEMAYIILVLIILLLLCILLLQNLGKNISRLILIVLLIIGTVAALSLILRDDIRHRVEIVLKLISLVDLGFGLVIVCLVFIGVLNHLQHLLLTKKFLFIFNGNNITITSSVIIIAVIKITNRIDIRKRPWTDHRQVVTAQISPPRNLRLL